MSVTFGQVSNFSNQSSFNFSDSTDTMVTSSNEVTGKNVSNALPTLTNSMNQITSDVQSLKNTSSTLESDVQSLKNTSSTLESDVQSLKNTSSTLESDVQSLKNTSSTLESDVQSLKNTSSTLESDVQSLKNTSSTLESDVQSLKNTSSTLESDVQYKDTITKIYNSTINSLAKIDSYGDNNQSDYRSGSGFIINVNDTVSLLTSGNLVSDTDSVVITLGDGNKYRSDLLGFDPVTTLALLSLTEVPRDKIIPLELANSTGVNVGQEVVAIDTFLDFSNLITSGIISGIEKSIPIFSPILTNPPTKYPNGIITDLNPRSMGYGGGPLLNVNGQVIGMNIQSYSDLSNSQVTFAIPSNSIEKIIPKLNSQGHYLHPWLGITGIDVTPDIAETLNLEEARGFLVTSVSNQSPSKLAGILGGDNVTSINGRPITLGGDVILKVDNKDINSIEEILLYIENEKNVGDNVSLTVFRNGILQTINVLLHANPDVMHPLPDVMRPLPDVMRQIS
ncbi:trypsin-like peptidase domain-containing protein [Candidatus Nitrosocosmicus sp. FF01]|uniref:trypsin-like peptidase domain-containing protein n=1 Tax=Candidatus Nitrosocosmicus sp. FF01 TaxID=3397670 RepID=UPI0039EBEA4D